MNSIAAGVKLLAEQLRVLGLSIRDYKPPVTIVQLGRQWSCVNVGRNECVTCGGETGAGRAGRRCKDCRAQLGDA